MGSSSNSQNSAGATDQALALSGSGGQTVAQDFGVALGQGATLTTGTRVVGNTTNSTITFNQGETGLGATFAATVKDLTEANAKALTDALSHQGTANLPSANKDIPDPNATNADAKDAGTGFSLANVDWQFWGYIAAGLAAAWYFFFRKR